MHYLLDFPLPDKDTSVAVIIVLAIVSGFLIPRPWHNARVRDKEKENEVLRAIIEKRDEQHDRLVDKIGTAIQLMEDIKADGRSGKHRTGD